MLNKLEDSLFVHVYAWRMYQPVYLTKILRLQSGRIERIACHGLMNGGTNRVAMPLFLAFYHLQWCMVHSSRPQYLFRGHSKVCILLFYYLLFFLGPFYTSGGPKSLSLCLSCPHHPSKPSVEAALQFLHP